MINIRKMSIDEIKQKPFLISQIYDLYSTVDDAFFEYSYNGEDRWLYSCGQTLTIIALEGEYIAYSTFKVDDDYNLVYMEYDGFDVYRHTDGSLVVSDEGSNVSEALSMLKRGNVEDGELNGIIMHHQINKKSGEDMVVAYLTPYRESKIFYPFNFKKPFFVCFIKGNKKKKYLIYETDSDYFSYDIITIKEFGLREVLMNGSYTLQRGDSIIRYFKVKHENSVGSSILLMPFSHPYKLEEIDNLIKEKGFTREVGENTLGYFNGEYPERDEVFELIDAIKRYDNGIDEIKKRELI